MTEIVGFPDCCGVIIVNKFKGGHPGSDPDLCIEPDELDIFLTKQEREFYGKRHLMAILSEPQNERIGDVFLKRKWVLLLNGTVNPRTGQELYIYFRDLNPTPLRHKRIFGK